MGRMVGATHRGKSPGKSRRWHPGLLGLMVLGLATTVQAQDSAGFWHDPDKAMPGEALFGRTDVVSPAAWTGPSAQPELMAGRSFTTPSWGCQAAAAMRTRLKVDNDLASGVDYGYSSGVMLEVSARTAAHDGWEAFGDEGWLCPLWRILGAGAVPSEYLSVRLDQAIYTPENSRAIGLLPRDRPYAATLMISFAAGLWVDGQHVRQELRLGWVGPSVRGESLQNSVHRIINAPRFRGWANQLHDEPLLEVAQYRVRRWQPGGRGMDVLGHWGGRLGNLQTSVFAGLEWRFGHDLQDDGGSAPLRPGSNEPGESGWGAGREVRLTGFLTAGARVAAHDLTLDGNTRHDSHRVKRRPVVLDVGIGLSGQVGAWMLQLMWVARTREFRGQRQAPSFGSMQLTYAF